MPSSATSTLERLVRAVEVDGDVCARRRGGRRCGAPPGRCAGSRAGAAASPLAVARLAVGLERRPRLRGRARASSTSLRSAPSSPSRSRSAGRSPKISERSSASASRASSRTRSSCAARLVGIAVEQRRGRLGAEVEAEQLLADDVVQLERQPVALGQDRQLAAALVQARVGDRDGGVRGEQLDQLPVERRRSVGAPPSRSGRRRRSPRRGRRSERRGTTACPGCARGHQPRNRGSPMDVVGPVGAVGLEHRAEHPVGAGQRPHRRDQLVAHPGDEKAPEAAGSVGDAERRVARLDQFARASRPAAGGPRRPTAATRPPAPRR